MEATQTPKQVTTQIEIVQTSGYDQTLLDAMQAFRERYPDRGEPKSAKFIGAYPAGMGENRRVIMEITH